MADIAEARYYPTVLGASQALHSLRPPAATAATDDSEVSNVPTDMEDLIYPNAVDLAMALTFKFMH
jgi:hypothetical protein